MILVVLLFVPPLGWLLLARRPDIDRGVRLALAALSAAIFVAIWAGALHLRP